MRIVATFNSLSRCETCYKKVRGPPSNPLNATCEYTRTLIRWPEPGSNRRHKDLQSSALPAELSSHTRDHCRETTALNQRYFLLSEKSLILLKNTSAYRFPQSKKGGCCYSKNELQVIKNLAIVLPRIPS